MIKLRYVADFFILLGLLSLGCSSANSGTINNPNQKQLRLAVTGDCNLSLDSKTNEIKLVSKIVVPTQSRARCIVRISKFNTQKQYRLVPLALKGTVKKAPATVSISANLVGDQPSRTSKEYTSPTKFDLTNQIPKTNYTTMGKSVLGINLVLSTKAGELELTDMRFALQAK